jgi:hypothetical protein
MRGDDCDDMNHEGGVPPPSAFIPLVAGEKAS